MRTARDTVASTIAAAIPAAFVSSSSSAPTDPPTKRTVIVSPTSAAPASTACPWRTYTVTVYAVTPLTAGDPADDDVDDLVDEVIDALDAVGLEWADVKRGTFLDTNPCYTLTVEVPA
jgi:hypothetical protein